ncbi:DNA-processing protein DprA [Thiorhodospira sibirica]|uniref:DNA-processing protein DprA n=1 Tax=Thiorhodospira sibirica TaxID=154347 RepID=UPI00022C284F|nr:DNA-processing protein DprA [Thiorhodospira sibirica]
MMEKSTAPAVTEPTASACVDLEQLYAWLCLTHTPSIGPVRFAAILAHYGSAQAAVADGLAAWRELGLKQATRRFIQQCPHPGVEADLAWAQQPGHYLLTWLDPRYPPLLKELNDAPPVLYVLGDPEVLALPQLAIVGSRRPSPGGIDTTATLSRQLSEQGLLISSGLALGIDAIAHEATLNAQGISIAVIGTGADRVYPARHRALAHRLVEQGAVVSEFPIGTSPKAENFPRRNRILSGLSLGTLVVEASVRSGSLITARLAAEQGREVFAVPGSIYNPLSHGCHQLIRQGAKLVETVEDILEEMAPLLAIRGHTLAQRATAHHSPAEQAAQGVTIASTQPSPALHTGEQDDSGTDDSDANAQHLLDCMGYDPVGMDLLVHRSGLTIAAISSMLTTMELKGYVESSPGGRYVRLK